MAAEIVKIDASDCEPALIRAGKVVQSGGVIVYPTDTFYGLGCDPRNFRAVRRLFEIKGRSDDQPIMLLLHCAEEVGKWAAEIPAQAEDLMKRFWPGPLTLVFRAKPDVLPLLTAGTGAIGLRVPGNTVTRGLLGFLDMALTGTSANVSGGPDPVAAEDARRTIGDHVDLILDGGPADCRTPSTIVDVSSGIVRMIRQGAVQLP